MEKLILPYNGNMYGGHLAMEVWITSACTGLCRGARAETRSSAVCVACGNFTIITRDLSELRQILSGHLCDISEQFTAMNNSVADVFKL